VVGFPTVVFFQCRSLISADDKCYFVTHTPDCDNGVGFISYLAFLYCATYSTFIGGIFILVGLNQFEIQHHLTLLGLSST